MRGREVCQTASHCWSGLGVVGKTQSMMGARWRIGWVDGVIVGGLVLGWWVWLLGPVTDFGPVADDTFRDTAYVENILAGRVLEDPSMLGLSWWYAPGGPVAYAALSRVTGVGPLALYGSSILWLHVWIPVLLFVVVRLYWDRTTALAAVVLVWLGSRWWQTHTAMPMPSVQGLVPVFAALVVWRAALRGGWGWSVVVGVVLGACTWHHMVCGIVVSVAIGVQALLWCVWESGGERYRALKRAAVAGGVCALLVSPLVLHQLTMEWTNFAHGGLGPELTRPAFWLQSGTPLMVPLAVVGAVVLVRRRAKERSWVLGYLGVGVAGQLPVLVGWLLNRSALGLLPHEFQWHGHIAVGILSAVGVVELARGLGRRCGRSNRSRVVTVGVVLALLAGAVGPDAKGALGRIDDYWYRWRGSADVEAASAWIREHTALTDVFLCRYFTGYHDVAGRTGRKLVLVPETRANPAADVLRRRRDWSRLENLRDPAEFVAIAVGRYGVGYAYLTDNDSDLLERWRKWSVFEMVYRSPNGERTILRIVEAGVGDDGGRAGGVGGGVED